MKKRKIRISEAANGLEALELLKTETPDCVLLDLMMPEMDGFGLIDRIVEDDVTPRPRIIVYSAKEVSDEEAEVLQKYTKAFIRKNGEPPETILEKMFVAVRPSSEIHGGEKTTPDIATAQPSQCNGKTETKAARLKATRQSLTCDFSDKNILIVDDEPRNIVALSRLLRSSGASLHTATDGREALEFLQDHRDIDCILMDMMMPIMNGYEAIERIRKGKQDSDIPIVAVTAKAMQEDRQKCLQAGATDFCTKPIEKAALLQTLSELLGP